ncbi:MAG: hypothetical protein KatS3mg039_0187 [Candidatus Kapaibacterium sp.]|nr:MAG: hypothetical protein KatS3mg039_0187 [Candidatus Kapabacteria bacterium]
MSEHQLERTVLVVAYWFPPHAGVSSFRAAQIARVLSARDWRVCVLHADSSSESMQDRAWSEELEQLGVERLPVPPSRKRLPSLGRRSLAAVSIARMIRQPFHTAPDYFDDWIESASVAAEHIICRYTINLVLGVVPPISAGLAANAIARKWNIPLALDIGESVELIPHRAPSYGGRNQDESLELLLRSALFVTVPSRQEKELLLRRHGFLTHEEIGILPFEDGQPMPSSAEGVCNLTVVAEELDVSILRPLLKIVRSESRYHLRIAADVSPGLERLLQKWRLSDRVVVERAVMPAVLDRWLAESAALLAYATPMQAIPRAIVHRAASMDVPIIAIGEYAAALVAHSNAERMQTVASNSVSALAAALATLPPARRAFTVAERDDMLEREFSRRLGMVMKL